MKNKLILTVAGTLALALALAGCTGGSDNSTAPQTNTAANSSSPVVQPEVYAQRKTELASLNQAVQQYNASEGHYPKTLQDLAPNYVPKVPEAPPGYKINYDPNSGTVIMVQQ